MSYSVYDAVCEILDSTGYLRAAFEYDLVNHAALARFLKPRIIEKTGDSEISTEAIVGAITRYLRHYVPTKASKSLIEFVCATKIYVKTGYEEIQLQGNQKTFEKLVEYQKKINWTTGEKMFVTMIPEQITVIIQENYAKQLCETIDKKDVLKHEKNKALLTFAYDPKVFYEGFGGINFYTWHFSSNQVCIDGIFSGYGKTIIMIQEKHATKMYQKLTEAINNFIVLHKQELEEKHETENR